MNDERDDGRSYVLRLWRERPATRERPAVWRLSLIDTSTGERRGFGCLQDLIDHLALVIETANQPQRREQPWEENQK